MNKLPVFNTILLFLLVGGSVSGSYSQTYKGDSGDVKQILTNIASFSRFYVNADYESLANSYTSDAKILPPGADIISGREAIKKRWTLPPGVSVSYHKATPTEIKIEGKYAYDIGYYEGTTRQKDGSESSWRGKYLIVWKKERKDWKIYADAWSRID